MNKKKVAIIGAGLSGLITAKLLSKEQFDVTVFEKELSPGGRMRTAVVNGWQLDLGFQVLLTGYPYLQKHVDLSKMNLLSLEPGASIFGEQKTSKLGDPARDLKFLIPTIFSFAGTFKDKALVFKLKLFVKKRSIDELFSLENKTTLQFLKDYGFSERIISNFFKPFYAGIFLEDELRTSSRMFLFIFKMFSEGEAVIPYGGIGKLCNQLAKNLDNVRLEFNAAVTSIEKCSVHYNSQKEDFNIIINTNPSFNPDQDLEWKKCHVFYFEHEGDPLIQTARIGLVAKKNKLINNIFYAHLAQDTNHKNESLLSVTVVNDQGQSTEDLRRKVTEEVSIMVEKEIKFVHHYSLPRSLPDIAAPENDARINVDNEIIHLGDYVLNGSQNAACKVAEQVAEQLNTRYR